MRKVLPATLFSILLLSTGAQAEFTQGSQTLAIAGGLGWAGGTYSYQPGSDEAVSGGGGAFGAQYIYYVKGTPAVGIGLDLTSSQNGTRTTDDMLAGGYSTDARVKSVVGLAIARLAYPRGAFRPFLFGGFGFHSSSQLLTATPQAGVNWPNAPTSGTRVLVDKHADSFAMGGGLGVDIFPLENIFMGTEVRFAWLAGLDTDQTAAINHAGFALRDHATGVAQANLLFRVGLKF